MLRTTHPIQDKEDQRWWKPDPSGNYTSKSAYSHLLKDDTRTIVDFKRLWKAPIPSKVSAFCWQLLHKKLPTKDNLATHEILTDYNNLRCCWCNSSTETPDHLLVNCNLASSLWMKCYQWWGKQYVLGNSCMKVLEQHKWYGGPKSLDKGWNIIWFAVVWTLWLGRNDKIFNAKEAKTDYFFQLVQTRSFYWEKYSAGLDGFSLTNWCENPTKCLMIKAKEKDRV
ncbi:hypothetical protein SLE2022_206430 [Rubroshorea leprosula]